MRFLVVLNVVLLGQVCLGGAIVSGPREESSSSSSSHSSSSPGVALTRRKRGWGWSSSPSNQVTKRPIGWSFGDTQEVTVKPKKTNRYVNSSSRRTTTASPVFYPNMNVNVYYGRPTKSLGGELVKAALLVGAAGAIKAYSKPVTPPPMTASQRAEARERRRQERLSRRSSTTPIAPVMAPVVEGAAANTTAVPLANSELIPVMMQDENKLLHIVYVPWNKIPPGGIPIATSAPFPVNPAAGGQLQQPSAPVPAPVPAPAPAPAPAPLPVAPQQLPLQQPAAGAVAVPPLP